MAWNTVTDVNDGQSFGGAAWQSAIDAIVQLQGALGSDVPAWASYTPVLGGSGWSLGSSGDDAVGQYIVIKDIVHFWARLVFGTVGMTFGTAAPTVSLPVNAHASPVAYTPRIGVGCGLTDSSAGPLEYDGVAELTASTVLCRALDASATYSKIVPVTNLVPFTWAASDVIRVGGWYRKA